MGGEARRAAFFEVLFKKRRESLPIDFGFFLLRWQEQGRKAHRRQLERSLRSAGSGGTGAQPWPTPGITQIDSLHAPHAVAYAMRGELGSSGEAVGLGVIYATRGPAAIEVIAFFGAYPADQPVQFAGRGGDGTVERFGAVEVGGRASGFHSPRLTTPQDADRFVRIALRPGALISNGYRSFWNRASAARNRQVREEFLRCVRRTDGE